MPIEPSQHPFVVEKPIESHLTVSYRASDNEVDDVETDVDLPEPEYKSSYKQNAEELFAKQEQFNQDVANSPFYNRAVAVFEGYTAKDRFRDSALPGYYRDYQINTLQKLQKNHPKQKEDIQRLFVASFVAGADANIAKAYGLSHRDVPIAETIKDNLGQIALGRYPEDRYSINARLAIQHELGWIGQLAHREGKTIGSLKP